jgi:hypothetical protein
MKDFTSPAEVERIATLEDPVVRNLQITQSYHELSAAMAKRTGACANWCTFATWASKQAGQTIRHEDVARALEHFLKNTDIVEQAIAEIEKIARPKNGFQSKENVRQIIWEAFDPKAAMERAGESVARGNQKVYAEIGREFARFIEACSKDQTFDTEQIARFCADFQPGPPPDGQQYLLQAFSRYYQAFFEPDDKTKAELILLANLEIGFHEQTRLQPEIAEALEASVVEPRPFMRRIVSAFFPRSSWFVYAGLFFMRLIGRPTALDIAAERFVTVARQRVRLFLTDHMMVLGFPNEVKLRLGDDLKAGFPAPLKQLVNADLLALLQQIDPTPDSLRESGAVDWADLPDRLHFIADLFRCYYKTADLLMPPFLPEQVEAIKGNRLPAGKL